METLLKSVNYFLHFHFLLLSNSHFILNTHEELGQYFGFVKRKPAGEVAGYCRLIGWPHLLSQSASFGANTHKRTTPIVFARLPANQGLFFHAVYQPRQVVFGQEQFGVEVAMAQSTLVGAFEFEQNIVPDQRREAVFFQIRLNAFQCGFLGADEPDPGGYGSSIYFFYHRKLMHVFCCNCNLLSLCSCNCNKQK